MASWERINQSTRHRSPRDKHHSPRNKHPHTQHAEIPCPLIRVGGVGYAQALVDADRTTRLIPEQACNLRSVDKVLVHARPAQAEPFAQVVVTDGNVGFQRRACGAALHHIAKLRRGWEVSVESFPNYFCAFLIHYFLFDRRLESQQMHQHTS